MTDRQPDIFEEIQADSEQRTEEPPMYRVILYNDDFTTKQFVVQILVVIFHKSLAEATQLMWRVHRQGQGVAGVFPREIAETKVATVAALARENDFPLRLSMEPES